MSTANLKPYVVPRNLDQDAWFLYQTTSIPYYELCARLCEEFAELYNRFITGHGLHGAARLDYWVSRYLTHAENIRRGIGFIKNGGDYMPMIGFLNSPATDYRGLVEQPLGWMSYEQRKQWDQVFERLSYACGTGSETLRNNETKGGHWLNRQSIGEDRVYLDRDNGHMGDLARAIHYAEGYGIMSPPNPFPKHPVDIGERVSPGTPCPRTGVWVPKQWLDGANDFSLAFCVQGQPMQPAYQVYWGKPLDVWADFPMPDDDDVEERSITLTETRAVDTTWYFVSQPTAQTVPASNLHLRCEAGQACPKSGYWITPAKSGSRRCFQQGTPMPEVISDYGSTIWQWDSDQSDPKL
ncbi:hypothetical protein LBM341_03428 (plasmid) [Ralstonia solanacearum]|uniref:hypothetical protein n=1 Tax=Ralstonia pseudosolanacearum TaxID=1310165 RepID=UPI0008555A01|nr:hypothetical protein [Ralstonia pseudosolanacearum]AOE91679.1 hypothetical protein LBM341_03428 [Ralstonia solanacearum]NKA15151.1 hypothetical protein [Ralstonia solanacearum]NKA51015.1 hypothetical protein [Ralstonia solanacearum]UYR14727.1 hypothetical protein NQS35_19130 [Ralstonia pseudosolanacearum]